MPRPCCCQKCTEGEEPTAGFSYEQTDDDPCTVDLFDESTVHGNCDGEIVQWKWYLNDEEEPFSTAQNPTGIVVEDGDEVRLWVKDACGCTDEVVMEILCIEPVAFNCSAKTYIFPSKMTVDFGAVGSYNDSDNGGCDTCDPIGGVWTLPLIGITACGASLVNRCTIYYESSLIPNGCGTGDVRYGLQFFVPCTGTAAIIVIANIQGAPAVSYQSTTPYTLDLRGYTGTLPFSVSAFCDVHPASATVS